MTRIIDSLDQIAPGYGVLYCDLWGCLHDGTRVFPEAVAALERFRARGGVVVLLTNSPRPAPGVALQIEALGAPRSCWDVIATSGDAAQQAMMAGLFGRRVFHIGPERDLGFFRDEAGRPFDVALVPLEEAEGIVCTGLFDDSRETPQDYRATLLWAKTKELKLLCANPDVVVDVGSVRLYCAGAIAAAYTEMGGESFYFGKPWPPIYALARDRVAALTGAAPPGEDILCIGDGIATDIAGAMGENLDCLFVTGGLAAEETRTLPGGGPDPALLDAFLREARMDPLLSIGFLR